MMTVPFLKGPVSWPWLLRAMEIPGSAIHVALLIQFFAGMRRTRAVRLRLAELPIGRGSADRGLRRLEAAGLVRVTRRKGRWPIVTIRGASPRSTGTRSEA